METKVYCKTCKYHALGSILEPCDYSGYKSNYSGKIYDDTHICLKDIAIEITYKDTPLEFEIHIAKYVYPIEFLNKNNTCSHYKKKWYLHLY